MTDHDEAKGNVIIPPVSIKAHPPKIGHRLELPKVLADIRRRSSCAHPESSGFGVNASCGSVAPQTPPQPQQQQRQHVLPGRGRGRRARLAPSAFAFHVLHCLSAACQSPGERAKQLCVSCPEGRAKILHHDSCCSSSCVCTVEGGGMGERERYVGHVIMGANNRSGSTLFLSPSLLLSPLEDRNGHSV